MMGLVRIRERGATPRNMRKALRAHTKTSWQAAGEYFHAELREKRFTERHARAARYTRRKGEAMPRGTRQFWRSYTGQKLRKHGHTRPLEFSGETRRLVRAARIVPTAKGVRVAYPGARKFNLRHPKSQIRMADEFRRVPQSEANMLATVFDARLNVLLARDNTSTTTEANR